MQETNQSITNSPKPSLVKRKKIPTLMGVVVLLVGMATGVVLVQREQKVTSEATGQLDPRDVRVTNVSDSSFTVIWTTDSESQGFVEWGETQELGQTAGEGGQNKSPLHRVDISGLNPNSQYYFNINSGGESFDDNGQPWSVKTGPVLETPGGVQPISGTVFTTGNSPATGAIVVVNLGGAASLSTTTTSNGNWIIPLSAMRTRDLSSYIQINDSETVLEILVLGADGSISTATAYPSSARPLASITLGQTYDFRNNSEGNEQETESNINLPEKTSTASSRFDTETTNPEGSASPATIESINEGEIISTNNPEFFGEGPAGAVITITIESDPVSEQVQVDSNGNWNWNPPTDLEEGSHTLTVTWRDANGILRSITRSFVVQAADEPAFESTPSATTTPTSTPTSTPKVASTTTPTPTINPTNSPTVSPISQSTPLPEAGVLTPTLVALMMGIGLVLTSLGIFIVANK